MADDGVIAPPYVINDNDKRGLVVVIAATTLSFVWTCLLIRIWLRFKLREWTLDDYLLVAATIVDTALVGIVFNVVNAGLGTSQEDLNGFDNLRRIGKDDFALQILYIITLLLSKCGVLLLYLRLSPRTGHRYASWGTMGVSAIWAIVAVALIAAPCKPSHYWPHGFEQCSNIAARWQAITALDIITEVAIFLISIYLIVQLNMKLQSKTLVVAAFSIRLPVIAAAATRLHYLEAMLNSKNMTLVGAYYLVCTQTQLGYAIMSSTFTGLGPFLRPFTQTPAGIPGSGMPSSALSKSHHSAHDEPSAEESASYQMMPLLAHNIPQGDSRRGSSNLNLRPQRDLMKQNTAVLGGGDMNQEDSVSRLSDDSQRMIITKRTEFTVEMDQASRESQGSPLDISKDDRSEAVPGPVPH